MAELTFKSPGVSTKEIDLSGPTALKPQGIPAGIIGTANQGPAFVPVTIATFGDYQTIFGKTDGEKFGPLAMYEWMKNAKAGTYLRVLGIGDGKKRLSSEGLTSNAQAIPAGGVKNSGFIAGVPQVKANGYIGHNAYAYNDNGGGILGRTFMLGSFMSESAGSHLLSDAAIQDIVTATAASGITTLLTDQITFLASSTGSWANNMTVKLQVEAAASYGAGVLSCLIDGNPSDIRVVIRLNTDEAAYGTEAQAVELINTGDIAAVTSLALTDASNLRTWIQATGGGVTMLTDASDEVVTLTGGANGNQAVPILRGMLMAASGVLPALSGNWTINASTASAGATQGSFSAGADGGSAVGSISCGGSTPATDYNFVMLLNGHKNTEQYPNTLTASLNPAKSNYIAEVFNTDPTKLQEAGHLLYTHYDIYTAQAVVTGSKILNATATKNSLEDAVFLISSSLGQNVGDTGSTSVPNFENFSDRFKHAFSPTFISQKIGGKNKNLFTIHALDAGSTSNTNFKISIENIKKSKVDDDYGQFDLIVRKFWDTDSTASVVETGESFRGLNLDPSSDDYIARRIGNIDTYFDFDKLPAAQKLVVAGVFSNKSRYIRVAMNSDVANAEMEKTALPVGFRGPYHLVTSGSSIMALPPHPLAATIDSAGRTGLLFSTASQWSRELVEPPIPYRESIANGTGTKKSINSSLFWGWQNTRITKIAQPNSDPILNKGVASFTKYHPQFSTARQALWVGANTGKLNSGGTIYDADVFNKNLFSLEQIQVHTKSSKDVVDAREWAFFAYRRSGELSGSLQKADATWSSSTYTRFLNVAKDFGDIASQKYYKFTAPVQGGFEGLNLFNEDKAKLLDNAAKREMDDEAQGFVDAPTVSAYAKALDVMAEKSDVDIQLLTIPGLREQKITDIGIEKTEERFDALYIMDLEETDVDNNVVTSSIQRISVGNTAETLKSRALDTSFAAVYFPDAFITDPNTLTNVRVPPSVVVLGAMALNDSVAYPWFAPAGFTRGALSSVIETKVKFSRNNLDTLYETDINPLTEFPTNPNKHVVWGQKTLLATASALDRVNVRRLLIDVRRKVRRVADTFIFEPNRESTLARFSAAVNPIMSEIQAQQGVDRYRVIIDATTTTQADVENNTVRGKIFLQPTRAVEFIALDFVITNNGTEI
jgi:hypothetical protein